ncbi:MAG: PDZ domain-containing protein [Pirellulaceae bacterium]|nr:PDZ domain-containing protein [Pirellulaceae bacterium]
MQVHIVLLGWLGCSLLFPANLFGQSSNPVTLETKYWAGIITQRWTNDGSDTIYLVPKMEVVDGVAAIRYEKQATPPLRIRRVMVDSPASRSGLQPGDMILAFNETTVSTHADLVAAIQSNGHQTATLHVLRGSAELSVSIHPIARPDNYADRVRQDRTDENDGSISGQTPTSDATVKSEVVALPGNLPGLLALAAQNQSHPLEPVEPSIENPTELPNNANFDRSTQLLIQKIEQFSLEWQELLERQKQTLKNLNGLR